MRAGGSATSLLLLAVALIAARSRHHHLAASPTKLQQAAPPPSLAAAAAAPANLTCPPNVGNSHAHPKASQQQQQADLPAASYGYVEAQVSAFVRPLFYTLRLKVDPMRRRFTGQLMVTLEVLAPPADDNSNDKEDKKDERGYRYLTLHAGARLQVSKAFYVYHGRSSVQIPATSIGKSAQDERLTLDFQPNLITAGQGLLLLVYSGAVNDTDSHGLFVHHSQKRPHLITPDNWERDSTGLATHMQPSFARRLLPCWDEPQLKARFSLVVVLPHRGYQTISNTPIRRKSITVAQCSGDAMQEVEFQTTPAMSTYLLTLIIGRFEHLEAVASNGCLIRLYVYSAPSSLSSMKNDTQVSNPRRSAATLGLQCAVQALDRLEQLLAIRYPLAKLDLIALREFNGGGMENWGASIFHENYLLYDANTQQQQSQNQSSQPNQQPAADVQVQGGRFRSRALMVPLVVAHELAHQWFGNLVTAANWSYLWLNEGFAQWLMYELAQHLEPRHQYWQVFLEDSRQSAMHEDELYSTSHSLEMPYDQSQDQLSLFDQITYNKGALVVRQLHSLLGAERFYSGLRHYLHKHSYLAVTSHDLWLALEEACRLPEGRLAWLMSGWLRQEGYPLLQVRVQEVEPNQWRLVMRQERFLLLKDYEREKRRLSTDSGLTTTTSKPSQQESSYVWQLPVGVISGLQPEPSDLSALLPSEGGQPNLNSLSFLVSDPQVTLQLAKSSTGHDWFKLNANATGYFRVDYRQEEEGDVDMLARMAEPVRTKRMGAVDRFNLVDDLFALVRSGHKRSHHYLAYLADAYSRETEPMVMRPILDSLKRLRVLLSNGDDQLQLLYDQFVQLYLHNISLASNFHSTSGHHQQQRELHDLVEAARVQFNDTQFLQRASHLFASNFRQQQQHTFWDGLDRDMRASILTGALLGAREQRDLAPDSALLDQLQPGGGGATARSISSSDDDGDDSDTFLRLLRAYAQSESSGERFAISSALGATQEPHKQAKLLNLTLLDSYFRPQDAGTVLESMARGRVGRQLMLEAALRHTKAIERRQMLAPLLKGLAPGLIDPNLLVSERLRLLMTNTMEQVQSKMRRLYLKCDSDNLGYVSVAQEQLLINSQWFKRDHQALLDYLKSLDLNSADNNNGDRQH